MTVDVEKVKCIKITFSDQTVKITEKVQDERGRIKVVQEFIDSVLDDMISNGEDYNANHIIVYISSKDFLN